jgi:hypothetical protein
MHRALVLGVGVQHERYCVACRGRLGRETFFTYAFTYFFLTARTCIP